MFVFHNASRLSIHKMMIAFVVLRKQCIIRSSKPKLLQWVCEPRVRKHKTVALTKANTNLALTQPRTLL